MFADWLLSEMKARGWEQAELAKAAGITASQVSRILSQQSNAGPEACQAIARAFHLPVQDVYRAAGLLPALPPETAERRQLSELVEAMSDSDVSLLLRLARCLS